MLRQNAKGQSSLPEYAIIFMLVIATIVGMAVYLQRSFQARMRDARNYVTHTAASACDTNCFNAAGNFIGYEYEPYYGKVATTTNQSMDQTAGLIGLSAQRGDTGISRKWMRQEISSNTISEQRPPKCADSQYATNAECM